MFHKILIANRGEIAVRIIRACRNMGIRSVAVYSKEDQNSLHVQLADQRVCIGEGPARNNYLNMERIITAARNVGADAIHPGFGFLSENADFVRLCNEYGIAFIGPTAEVINSMGNKSHARQTMMDAKVPVVPGTREPVYDAETGEKFAAVEKVCARHSPKTSLNFISTWHNGNLQMRLAMIQCTSKNISKIRAMWKFRSWQTISET